MTTAFGSHCSVSYSLDEMLALYEKPLLWYSEVVWVLLVGWCYYAVKVYVPAQFPRAAEDEEEQNQVNKWTSVHWAVLGGLFAANQNILLKSAGELCEKSIADGDNSHWSRCRELSCPFASDGCSSSVVCVPGSRHTR